MKKRLFAMLLAVAMTLPVALLAGCASSTGVMDTANNNSVAAGDSSLPVVTWKMGSTWGSGNIHFTCDQRFSELVSELTGGRFTITNYSEGELCSASQLFDYVEDGTIQCGGDWGGYWSGKDTTFELLSTTMDNFSGLDYYVWIYQAGGLDCYQNMYGQYNMMYFPIMINHAESGIRSTSPITSIADMQKMKIRLGGVMAGRVAKKLGINITTVPAAELYESLQRGVIDGGEFSTPCSDDSLKLQEVAKYWCSPAWYQSAGVNGVMINLDAWNALPEEYQQAIQIAAETCTGEKLTSYLWNDFAAVDKMLNQDGCIVTHLNAEDKETIRKTCREVYQAESASNKNFDTVYSSMMAYREKADTYRAMLGDYGWGFNYSDENIDPSLAS
jgi:TRAP-type mannitol/chloroaromatic compound transport system substrate-binding protein